MSSGGIKGVETNERGDLCEKEMVKIDLTEIDDGAEGKLFYQ